VSTTQTSPAGTARSRHVRLAPSHRRKAGQDRLDPWCEPGQLAGTTSRPTIGAGAVWSQGISFPLSTANRNVPGLRRIELSPVSVDQRTGQVVTFPGTMIRIDGKNAVSHCTSTTYGVYGRGRTSFRFTVILDDSTLSAPLLGVWPGLRPCRVRNWPNLGGRFHTFTFHTYVPGQVGQEIHTSPSAAPIL
jgi:hypothetical protein